MHGIKKDTSLSEEEKAKQQQIIKTKITKYRALLEELKQRKKDLVFDDETIKLTEELLKHNGDCYTMWNYRRQLLLDKFDKLEPTDRINALNKELEFTQQIGTRYPKSYWCWNQREWTTLQLEALGSCDWKRELAICGKFLEYDARNFHCWNYRRYVVAKSKNISDQDELDFTMKLIEENFSNYSAWHQRSKLLPLIHTDKEEFIQAITEELDIIQNAFYTMPNDSSAWFYHRWLVSQNPTQEIFAQELSRIEELLTVIESDTEKKWPKLTSVFLMKQMGGKEKEISETLKELTRIDPNRKNYYTYLLDSHFE